MFCHCCFINPSAQERVYSPIAKLFRFLSGLSPKSATGPENQQAEDRRHDHGSEQSDDHAPRDGEGEENPQARDNVESNRGSEDSSQSRTHRVRGSRKSRETASKHELDHYHHTDAKVPIDLELTLTASDYKNTGNKLCSLYRYEEAIHCYSKAIAKNPGVPVFYSNKALCHLKLQQWAEAAQSARKALELDSAMIKGYIFLGQALAEMGDYEDALKHLQRAHELAREKQLNYGDDITYQIRSTKRRLWSKNERENDKLEDELHSYLVSLIERDTQAKLEEARKRIAADPVEGPSSSSRLMEDAAEVSDAKREAGAAMKDVDTEDKIRSKCDIYMNKLGSIFTKLKLQQDKREVPEYLCGKISFEIMHDPVITPSGITYDRQDIEEHLRRVGHFDPITRHPLTADQLVPNLAMKEVVDAYLSENEWAHYY